jgi:hypothetical protein
MDEVVALDGCLVGDSGLVVRVRLGDQVGGGGLLWTHSGGHVGPLVCLNRVYLRLGLDR